MNSQVALMNGQTIDTNVELSSKVAAESVRHYTIEEHLGSGMNAEVYRAKEEQTGRDVVLKILHEECSSAIEQEATFRHEAEGLVRLVHPNIIRLYNFGRFGANFFVELEYLKGVTFEKILQERRRLDIIESLIYFIQIFEGLKAIHTAGIVHNELKPSNIVSSRGRIVISDFGFGQGISDVKPECPEEYSESQVYQAPEQVMRKQTSPATDIYAAGVILYRSLTGLFPHDACIPGSCQKHLGPIIPVSQQEIDLPEPLTVIVDIMLSRNPSNRPGANDILIAIKELLAEMH